MNRLAALTLAAGLACALAADTADLAAAESMPQALLTDAILCKVDPLTTVRKMAASGSSSFDRGFAAATFGEEMDEMDVVILRSPLEIAGARHLGHPADLRPERGFRGARVRPRPAR